MQTVATYGASRKSVFIDLHQDMLSGVGRLGGDFPAYGSNYLTGSHRAAAILSAIYPLGAQDCLISQLQAHKELLGTHSDSLRLVTTARDLVEDDARTGVLPHSEGLHLSAIEPEGLEELWAEYCLRSLSLTWNHETEYGFGCHDDSAKPLKSAGRQLLNALERSPIILDLAHLNDAGFYEALELYPSPVLVSHTFCRAIVDHPRGLTDEQLRAVGEHGGLIGLAFPPDFLGEHGSVDEAIRHVDRIASLAGEDAVSIGSDWGVAAMGELGGPTSLAWLFDAINRSHSAELAEKFAFDNAYAFLQEQLPAE